MMLNQIGIAFLVEHYKPVLTIYAQRSISKEIVDLHLLGDELDDWFDLVLVKPDYTRATIASTVIS